jgi:hypothetical protein
MGLLYADEDFDYSVVERLRQMGHDVVTVQEAGRRGGNDAQVLSNATVDGRAVLTFNRWDFDRLHRQIQTNAGIVSCSRDDDVDALANRIDQAVATAGTLTGQHIRVNR